MLRIVQTGKDQPMHWGGIDKGVHFTPGQIQEITIIGNQVLVKENNIKRLEEYQEEMVVDNA